MDERSASKGRVHRRAASSSLRRTWPHRWHQPNYRIDLAVRPVQGQRHTHSSDQLRQFDRSAIGVGVSRPFGRASPLLTGSRPFGRATGWQRLKLLKFNDANAADRLGESTRRKGKFHFDNICLGLSNFLRTETLLFNRTFSCLGPFAFP